MSSSLRPTLPEPPETADATIATIATVPTTAATTASPASAVSAASAASPAEARSARLRRGTGGPALRAAVASPAVPAPTSDTRRANPSVLPADPMARMEWLRAVGAELDDRLTVAAIGTFRDVDADAAERDAAVATLWRATSRAIEGTYARLCRLSPGTPRHELAEAVSDSAFTAIVRFQGRSVGELVAHVSAWVSGTHQELRRRRARAAAHESLDLTNHGGHADLSPGPMRTTYDMVGAKRAPDADAFMGSVGGADTGTPDADVIEAVLEVAIVATAKLDTQQTVLRHYFGIGPFRGQGEQNRAALARQYPLTAERIRQLAERVRVYLHEQLDVPLDD